MTGVSTLPASTIGSQRFAVCVAWREAARITIGAALIMLAVAVNRAPTVFTDSDDYYELGRQIVTDVAAHLNPAPAPVLSVEEAADAAQVAEDRHMGHSQMASRSSAYALFLYPLEVIGTLWLVTAVQALLVAWLVRTLWRAAVPDAPPWHYLAGMALLAGGTTLPFFAGFAMPDIFAGMVVLGTALLTLYWQALGTAYRWAVGVVLAMALAVHMSHLLLGITLFPLALGALWRVSAVRAGGRELGALAAALVAAWLFNAAYVRIDQIQTGELLRRQPFLAARVLADGPGRDYLRRACATAKPYVLCSFAAEPLDDSEVILWSDQAADGVFLRSDYATRLELEDEELPFVRAVIADNPGGVAAAALRNWWRQLVTYQVEEPVRDPEYYLTDEYWKDTFLPEMIRGVADCGPAGDRCPSRMTPARSSKWHGTGLVIAGLAITGVWWRQRGLPSGPARRQLTATVVLLLGGVMLNAAVCGILSGPFARYEARLVWLVPLAALLLVSALFGQQGGEEAGDERLDAKGA